MGGIINTYFVEAFRIYETEGGGISGESRALCGCRRCKVLKSPNLSGKRTEQTYKNSLCLVFRSCSFERLFIF